MVTCEAQNKHSGSPLLTICIYVYHILTHAQEATDHLAMLIYQHSVTAAFVTCFTDGCPCGYSYPWNVASTDAITCTIQITDQT